MQRREIGVHRGERVGRLRPRVDVERELRALALTRKREFDLRIGDDLRERVLGILQRDGGVLHLAPARADDRLRRALRGRQEQREVLPVHAGVRDLGAGAGRGGRERAPEFAALRIARDRLARDVRAGLLAVSGHGLRLEEVAVARVRVHPRAGREVERAHAALRRERVVRELELDAQTVLALHEAEALRERDAGAG